MPNQCPLIKSAFFSFQICPICAALPGGDPNHVTDDFAAHLTLEHRAPRDLISFPDATKEKVVCNNGHFDSF